jgi:hypothetical protein
MVDEFLEENTHHRTPTATFHVDANKVVGSKQTNFQNYLKHDSSPSSPELSNYSQTTSKLACEFLGD